MDHSQLDAAWSLERLADEHRPGDLLFAISRDAEPVELPQCLAQLPGIGAEGDGTAISVLLQLAPEDQQRCVETYRAVVEIAAGAMEFHVRTLINGSGSLPHAVTMVNLVERCDRIFVRYRPVAELPVAFRTAASQHDTAASHHDTAGSHPSSTVIGPPSEPQTVARSNPVWTMSRNRFGVITHIDEALATTLGFTPSELVGAQLARLVHPDDLAFGTANFLSNRDIEGARWSTRQRMQHQDGSWRLFELLNESRPNDPEDHHVATTWIDLTSELYLSDAIRQSEQHFRNLAESLPAAVVTVAVGGTDFWANNTFWEMTGRDPEGFSTADWLEIVHPEDRAACETAMATLFDHRTVDHEYRFIRSDGAIRNGRIQIRLTSDDRTGIDRMIACLFDVTEQRHAEHLLEWQASHGALTGLANRTAALERLGQLLGDPTLPAVSLLFLDLDDFKDINDSLGHDRGDLMLQALSARISTNLRPQDLLARLGGDEFVMICPGVESPDSALAIANRILAELIEPMSLDGLELAPSASIGIAIGHSDGSCDPVSLIRDADTAMYEAKRRGRRRVELFGTALRRRVLDRVELEGELRNAISDHDLIAHYQPIVDPFSGELYGLESLVRWVHPTKGLLLPGRFLPAAASSGLTEQLDREMLRRVMTEVGPWLDQLGSEFPSFTVGVNLAGSTVANPDTPGHLLALATDLGFDLTRLTVEVTESDLIDNLDGAVANLTQLRDHGIGVALDDFGVGYSSLTYLRQLPATYVKLDQSFIRALADDVSSRIIAGTVVQMAHRLGLSVIAEGIETTVHLEEVRSIDVDSVQGFGICRPVEIFEALATVRGDLPIIRGDDLVDGDRRAADRSS